MKTKTYNELDNEFTKIAIDYVTNAKNGKTNGIIDETDKLFSCVMTLLEKLKYGGYDDDKIGYQPFITKTDYNSYPTIFKKYVSQKHFYENLIFQNAFKSEKYFEDGLIRNIIFLISKMWEEIRIDKTNDNKLQNYDYIFICFMSVFCDESINMYHNIFYRQIIKSCDPFADYLKLETVVYMNRKRK